MLVDRKTNEVLSMADVADHEVDAEEVTPPSEEDQAIRRKELVIRYLRTWQRVLPIAVGTILAAYTVLHGSYTFSSYSGRAKATFVILVGMFSLLQKLIRSRIQELEADQSILRARKRVQEQLPGTPEDTSTTEDTYFDNLVKINVENLAAYYELVKIQTDKSFRASLGIAYFGGSLIVVGLALGFFRTDATDKVTYIATGAGVLTEFIAGVFFWLYSKTVRQLRDYHDSLISVQNVLLSFKLVSDTKDPKDKAEMVSKMCSYLMTSLSRQVAQEKLSSASVVNGDRPE
jgi:hypothetical protein